MNKCDVVIPVYNAYDYLEACISSVLKKTKFKGAQLILIDDKSTDERVLPLLRKIKKENTLTVELIENEKNLGFVGTVNKGLKFSKNDVVVLNSDTEVSDGWMDRLRECAYSDSNIATVTPLSSNAGLASIPIFNKDNDLPRGYSVDDMSRIVDECSMRIFPEIPSGHGFCLYIKRDALEKVGYFDEKTFGKGYGEENDFCFRCFKYGYRHVLCDAAYVQHKGAQSFGEKGSHLDELERKYPEIMKEVGWWYARRDVKIVGDNIALRISTMRDKINILVIAKKVNFRLLKLIEHVRKKANVHVLCDMGGRYEIKSFFDEYNLVTAIYDKPIVMYKDESNSEAYQRMMREIMDIFGISVVTKAEGLNEEILEKMMGHKKAKEVNYVKVLDKMKEYDFVRRIEINREIIGAKEMEAQIEKRKIEDQEWRENLTLLQRIYLKIRYILLGR